MKCKKTGFLWITCKDIKRVVKKRSKVYSRIFHKDNYKRRFLKLMLPFIYLYFLINKEPFLMEVSK